MVDSGAARTTRTVGLIQREALLVRLAHAADVPVVVVHAGAGFGKSTLAAQWAQRDARPHVLVRVAPFLDDPAALALALVDALESVGPAGSEIRSVATAAEPRFSAVLLPAVTRLAASRGRAFVLVVDDVHLLTRPDCHVLLRAVADGMPDGSQLVLLSRLEPPGWIARSRAEGRVLDLTSADLAFDERESRDVLELLGVQLTGAQADALAAGAEGWPVGLYLMALAMRTRGERGWPDSGIPTGSDRFLVDYLRAEVLAGLPDGARDFLRQASILDELDGPTCDAVLGRNDSAAVLAELSRHLPLVVPVDPEGRRYRYHHLLADALRAELETHEPWRRPELHLRASRWFESKGEADPAIRHAKAAGDLERVGKLVWAGVPGCIATGRPDRLGAWLGDIDESALRSDQWLTLAAAWLGLQIADPDRMTRWILAAEEHAGPGWQGRVARDVYPASLAAIEVTVGDRGLAGSIALCQGMQQGLPPQSSFRAVAFLNEGVALTLTRRLPEGLASLQQAERLGRALGLPIIEANALAWQGLMALLADDWSVGAPLLTRADDLIRAHRLDRLATSAICVTAVALLHAARGNKDQARVTLGTARRLTSQVSQIAPWFAVAGPLVQARAAIVLSDRALARALWSQARAHMTPDLAGTLLRDILEDTDTMLRALPAEGSSGAALTAAELRVLQFLPSRLTFPQIGEHLFLSQTTIKTHAQSIYRKLGASSRDEAVARAQSLGLVEATPLS